MSVSTESILIDTVLDTTQADKRGKRLGCTTSMARPHVASISVQYNLHKATANTLGTRLATNRVIQFGLTISKTFRQFMALPQMKSFQLPMPTMLLAPTATQT
jgi:hypothetical protein